MLLLLLFYQHSMAIFVHPSGVKRPLKHSIDDMVMLHGDKKGKQFSVWVDQVYSAEIALNTWLVKFYKWELCGKFCSVICFYILPFAITLLKFETEVVKHIKILISNILLGYTCRLATLCLSC